jgi:hypothetical protein
MYIYKICAGRNKYHWKFNTTWRFAAIFTVKKDFEIYVVLAYMKEIA